VVADLELEAVEQFTLDLLGQPAKISFDDWQPVKQARIAHGGRFRAPGQVGELDLQVLPQRGDLGEAFAELAAPLLVNVFVIGRPVVAKLLDHVGLLTLQVSDLGAQRGCPRCRATYWVADEAALDLAQRRLGRYRVLLDDDLVAVWRVCRC
jgi:hypothetical protein